MFFDPPAGTMPMGVQAGGVERMAYARTGSTITRGTGLMPVGACTPASPPGGVRLVRALPAKGGAERWSATDATGLEPLLVYRFTGWGGGGPPGDLVSRMRRLSTFSHRHLLLPRQVGTAVDGSLWLFTDYPGTHAGLVSLADVLASKPAGVVEAHEARHAADQLLRALSFGHSMGYWHGGLTIEDVLVDRHGAVRAELFGVRPVLSGMSGITDREACGDVRAAAAIVYELLTGMPASEARVPVSKAAGRRLRAWDAWIERGLTPAGGFASAMEAADAIPAG